MPAKYKYEWRAYNDEEIASIMNQEEDMPYGGYTARAARAELVKRRDARIRRKTIGENSYILNPNGEERKQKALHQHHKL